MQTCETIVDIVVIVFVVLLLCFVCLFLFAHYVVAKGGWGAAVDALPLSPR